MGGTLASQNRLGQIIVGNKFMPVICTKVLLKLAMGTKVFLKLSHASTLAIWIEEIQAKSEE